MNDGSIAYCLANQTSSIFTGQIVGYPLHGCFISDEVFCKGTEALPEYSVALFEAALVTGWCCLDDTCVVKTEYEGWEDMAMFCVVVLASWISRR